MPLVRTQDEIVARIEEVAQGPDVLGFMREVLIYNLDFQHAEPFLREDVNLEEYEWDLDHRCWNPDRKAEEYLAFAIGKIRNHRGISAGRSVQKLSTWAWLMGRDDLVKFMEDEDNYAQYGAPAVKRFAQEMGWSWPSDDEALERMASGLPCKDDCMSGCGLL